MQNQYLSSLKTFPGSDTFPHKVDTIKVDAVININDDNEYNRYNCIANRIWYRYTNSTC